MSSLKNDKYNKINDDINSDLDVGEECSTPLTEEQHRIQENQQQQHDSESEPTVTIQETLTPAGLMVLIYFWTCGGPFGIESAVHAGGAALTFTSLVAILLFWSIPQALMSAELSLMIRCNGGNVVWVQRAFGDFVGFVNAFCALFMNLDNQAIFIALFVKYLPVLPESLSWTVRIGVVTLSTVINIWSVSFIAKLSWFLLVFVFTPFFALIVVIVMLKIPIKFSGLTEFPEFQVIGWNLLFSTIVWNFGGLDLIGFVAGEVKGGKKGFVKGVAGSLPLILFNYVFPVFVVYLVQPDYRNWDTGYFVTLVSQPPFPTWLRVLMTVATCAGVFGMQLSSATTTSRLIWAMAKGKDDRIGQHRYLPRCLSMSMEGGKVFRPLAAILVNGLITLALSALSVEKLVPFFTLLRIVNLLFEYGALVYLRFLEPDTHRPFVVPGGKMGVVAMVLPTVLLSALAVGTSDWEVLAFGGGAVLFSVLAYGWKIAWVIMTNKRRKERFLERWKNWRYNGDFAFV